MVITEVVSANSIVFATAQRALDLGAEVLLTAPDRDRGRAEQAAHALNGDVHTLDVNDPAGWDSLEGVIRDRWTNLDGALDAVAYAPADALDADFFAARTDSLTIAFHTSATSYAALAGLVGRLAPPPPLAPGSSASTSTPPARGPPTTGWA